MFWADFFSSFFFTYLYWFMWIGGFLFNSHYSLFITLVYLGLIDILMDIFVSVFWLPDQI